MDGTYQGSVHMIDPPGGMSGTQALPITIRALNDGQVLIDGQFARVPIVLNNNDWWIIDGMNAKNGTTEVISISNGSSNNILRRIVAWDAWWNANGSLLGVHYGSANNLIEDVGLFGVARKSLNNSQTYFSSGDQPGVDFDNTIFRRVFVQSHGNGDDGLSVLSRAYNSYGQLAENMILSMDQRYGAETFTRTSNGNDVGLGSNGGDYKSINMSGISVHENGGSLGIGGSPGGTCYSTRFLGSIVYLGQSYVMSGNGNDGAGLGIPIVRSEAHIDCETMKDIVAFIHPNNAKFNKYPGFSLPQVNSEVIPSPIGVSATFLTSVRSNAGGATDFYGARWGVGSTVSQGTSLAAVESPWTATATGANLCYEYVDGVKTSVPLWPWRMEDRIKNAMAAAGSFSGSCLGCSGGRIARPANFSVTGEIEANLGTIPAQCRK
jgi:hypothetical protein